MLGRCVHPTVPYYIQLYNGVPGYMHWWTHVKRSVEMGGRIFPCEIVLISDFFRSHFLKLEMNITFKIVIYLNIGIIHSDYWF